MKAGKIGNKDILLGFSGNDGIDESKIITIRKMWKKWTKKCRSTTTPP